MHAMPFRLVGCSALRAVQAALARAVSSWAAEWGVDQALMAVAVERAWETTPSARMGNWNHGGQAGERNTWFACSDDFRSLLQLAMFGAADAPAPAGKASLAPAGACQAGQSLLDLLGRAALASQQGTQSEYGPEVPAACWQRGGGAVVAHVAVGGQVVRVLLDSAAVQAVQLPPAALPALLPADLNAGLAKVPVALQLCAGSARVGLGSLMALSAGDVLRLGTPGDAPLSLQTLSGSPILAGYLGRCGDSVAVELVHPKSLLVGAVK